MKGNINMNSQKIQKEHIRLPNTNSKSHSSENRKEPKEYNKPLEQNIVGSNCKFDIEILCSPAQRISGDPGGPQPLAEDVVGIKFIPPNFLMGFVADGAPGTILKINTNKENENSLNGETIDKQLIIFGSREMAKLIGKKVFFKCALDMINDKNGIGEEWKENFTNKFKEYLEKESRKTFEPFLEDIPPEKFTLGPNDERFIQFQVSFVGFLLDLNSSKLFLFMPGDTKACIGIRAEKHENAKYSPVNIANPIFLKIIKTSHKNLEAGIIEEPSPIFRPMINNPTIKIEKNVSGIMLMSDGVINNKIFKEKCTNSNSFYELCNSLKELDFRSADDKALLIVSLEENYENNK